MTTQLTTASGVAGAARDGTYILNFIFDASGGLKHIAQSFPQIMFIFLSGPDNLGERTRPVY